MWFDKSSLSFELYHFGYRLKRQMYFVKWKILSLKNSKPFCFKEVLTNKQYSCMFLFCKQDWNLFSPCCRTKLINLHYSVYASDMLSNISVLFLNAFLLRILRWPLQLFWGNASFRGNKIICKKSFRELLQSPSGSKKSDE